MCETKLVRATFIRLCQTRERSGGDHEYDWFRTGCVFIHLLFRDNTRRYTDAERTKKINKMKCTAAAFT